MKITLRKSLRLQNSAATLGPRPIRLASLRRIIRTLGVTMLLVSSSLNSPLQANTATTDEPGASVSTENAESKRDAVEQIAYAKLALTKGNSNSSDLRMDLGRAYMNAGMYDAALEYFLWIFDEGPKYAVNKSYSGVRVSFLLGDIGELAKAYPPAMEALVVRRDTLYESILTNTADYLRNRRDIDSDFSALADTVGDEKYIFSVFDQLEGDKSTNRLETLKIFVNRNLDHFDQRGLHDVVVKYVDMRRKVDSSVKSYGDAVKYLLEEDLEKSVYDAWVKHVFTFPVRRRIANYYKISLATNNHKDAEYAAEKLVGLLDDALTYYELAKAGVESGNPSEENVDQARKAVELEPSNATFVDILIQLLHATGSTGEAIGVAKDFLSRDLAAEERSSIEETLDSLH